MNSIWQTAKPDFIFYFFLELYEFFPSFFFFLKNLGPSCIKKKKKESNFVMDFFFFLGVLLGVFCFQHGDLLGSSL